MTDDCGSLTADALRQRLLDNADRMDRLFFALAERGLGPDLKNPFIHLCLSAQSHCRRSVETLSRLDEKEFKKLSNELLGDRS
jgi:hypothetical protein